MNTLSNKKMIDFLGVEEPEKYCKKKKVSFTFESRQAEADSVWIFYLNTSTPLLIKVK